MFCTSLPCQPVSNLCPIRGPKALRASLRSACRPRGRLTGQSSSAPIKISQTSIDLHLRNVCIIIGPLIFYEYKSSSMGSKTASLLPKGRKEKTRPATFGWTYFLLHMARWCCVACTFLEDQLAVCLVQQFWSEIWPSFKGWVVEKRCLSRIWFFPFFLPWLGCLSYMHG